MLVVNVVFAALLAQSSLGTRPLAAKGDDVCPESNDSFQAACYLGADSDALGFISQPGDVDAYRFEVRDFGAVARVTLPDRPLPYRLNLADWNGDVIATGDDGNLQTRLTLPGSYYVFVDSGTGQFSDGAPYRIALQVTYAAQPVPEVLYEAEYRGGPRDVFTETGSNTLSDEDGDYTIDQGRITIAMRVGGSPEEPMSAKFYVSPDPPYAGPVVDDFTLIMDARLVNQTNTGFTVLFRYVDDDNYYQADMNLMDQEAIVTRVVGGELLDVTDWVPAPSLRADGVNRVVIRCVGDEIRVNVNGLEVARATDDTFQRGMVGYGAIAYGDPPTVNFDNMLVTTPTRR